MSNLNGWSPEVLAAGHYKAKEVAEAGRHAYGEALELLLDVLDGEYPFGVLSPLMLGTHENFATRVLAIRGAWARTRERDERRREAEAAL